MTKAAKRRSQGRQSHQQTKQFPAPHYTDQATMSAEPTSEEQKKADEELKAKEAAEQAALPYKWTQTISDLDVTITIDAKYKGRDLDVKLSKNALKVGIKGQEPFIDVSSPFTRTHSYIIVCSLEI